MILILAAGVAMATISMQPVHAAQNQAPVREQIFQLLEHGALHRDEIDWKAARRQLQAASVTADADRVIDRLIAQSTGGHGHWVRSPNLPATYARVQQSSAAGGAGVPADTNTREGGNAHNQSDRQLGWIAVPTFKEDITAKTSTREQQKRAFARNLQSQLRQGDQDGRCGWIVDLRENRGGNMWPMLLGVAPLLSEDPGHQTVLGAFEAGAQRQVWGYHGGKMLLEGRPVMDIGPHVYVMRHPRAPVAVLIGPHTSSSGEALVLAFRGRHSARSFGQRTAGFSTANRPVRLNDGSVLLLTESVTVDRNFQGTGGKLEPDVIVHDAAAAEVAARNWLMEQTECVGRKRTS